MPILRLGESRGPGGLRRPGRYSDPAIFIVGEALVNAIECLLKALRVAADYAVFNHALLLQEKITRGRRRLLAPLSRQRLLIGMGHKGARSVKPMLWCGP